MLKRPNFSSFGDLQKFCLEKAALLREKGELETRPAAVNDLAPVQTEDARLAESSQLAMPFPTSPEGKVCAPNDMIRSSFFGAIERGERRRINDFAVAGPNNITILLNGWRLDQIDAEIFFWLHDRASGTKPGEFIHFKLWDLLKHLGYEKPGGVDYEFIKNRLTQMHDTTVRYKTDRGVGGVGNLIRFFDIEETTKEAIVQTNEHMRRFFNSTTHLSTEHTASLKGSPLALWLYRVISSHAEWTPMLVKTVLERSGSKSTLIKHFKQNLNRALEKLKEKGHIHSYTFQRGVGGELLHISRTPSPTQIRHLARRPT